MDNFTIITIIVMVVVGGGLMFVRNKFGSNDAEGADWGAEGRKFTDDTDNDDNDSGGDDGD